MSNSKISLDVIERFFILIIDNEHAKNMFIQNFLLKVSAGSIGIPCYLFARS